MMAHGGSWLNLRAVQAGKLRTILWKQVALKLTQYTGRVKTFPSLLHPASRAIADTSKAGPGLLAVLPNTSNPKSQTKKTARKPRPRRVETQTPERIWEVDPPSEFQLITQCTATDRGSYLVVFPGARANMQARPREKCRDSRPPCRKSGATASRFWGLG